MIDNNLLKEIESFVIALYENNHNPQYTFHCLEHTKSVAKRAGVLATKSCLSETETNIVTTAAWFHDCGYLFTNVEHEIESQKIATDFLTKINIDETTIKKVCECIAATKFPQNPTSPLAELVCDADLSHLANVDFFCISGLFKTELDNLCCDCIDEAVYWEETKRLFEKHHYFTPAAIKLFGSGKKRNYEILKNKIAQLVTV